MPFHTVNTEEIKYVKVLLLHKKVEIKTKNGTDYCVYCYTRPNLKSFHQRLTKAMDAKNSITFDEHGGGGQISPNFSSIIGAAIRALFIRVRAELSLKEKIKSLHGLPLLSVNNAYKSLMDQVGIVKIHHEDNGKLEGNSLATTYLTNSYATAFPNYNVRDIISISVVKSEGDYVLKIIRDIEPSCGYSINATVYYVMSSRKAAIDLGWKISNMTSFYRKFPTSDNEVFSV